MKLHGGRQYAFNWISGIRLMAGCDGSVNQALNDIEAIDSWTAPAHRTGWTQHKVLLDGGVERPIFHQSAGKIGTKKTCSLFFIQEADTAYVIAVAKHSGPTTYDTVWTRDSFADFPTTIDVAAKQPLTVVQR